MYKSRLWYIGERFSYLRQDGRGWAYGTVLEIDGTRVIARLDCQSENQTYPFYYADPRFVKGEVRA